MIKNTHSDTNGQETLTFKYNVLDRVQVQVDFNYKRKFGWISIKAINIRT